MLEIVQGCNAMFKNVQELERFPVKCRGIMCKNSTPPFGEKYTPFWGIAPPLLGKSTPLFGEIEIASCLYIRVYVD
jgi:hypothetical protein